MEKDYSRNISMHCPLCGNDLFSAPDLEDIEMLGDAPDDTRIQCSDCKTIYTKAELIDKNERIINANVEDIADEFAAEVQKELDKQLKHFSK